MRKRSFVTATKEYTWDCAHMLAGHEGLCRNLHGHTYRMLVTVEGIHHEVQIGGPSDGMVVDFKHLKNVVKELIVDPLDHATIIDVTSTEVCELAIMNVLQQYNRKLYLVRYRPTAENMAISFLDSINHRLSVLGVSYRVIKLRLYETPTSYAEVEQE